jgi:hypothetical protein
VEAVVSERTSARQASPRRRPNIILISNSHDDEEVNLIARRRRDRERRRAEDEHMREEARRRRTMLLQDQDIRNRPAVPLTPSPSPRVDAIGETDIEMDIDHERPVRRRRMRPVITQSIELQRATSDETPAGELERGRAVIDRAVEEKRRSRDEAREREFQAERDRLADAEHRLRDRQDLRPVRRNTVAFDTGYARRRGERIVYRDEHL